jgi:hypothetical protein
MSRLLPLFVAVVLAAGFVVALPDRVVACSCPPSMPLPLAEAAARSPDLAIFTGRVVAVEGDPALGGVAAIEVEGRFRGPLPGKLIRVRHGSGGDCSIRMTVGERRLFTARLDEQGVWFPSLCDPQALLGTPEGDALLAEAIEVFGPPQPVGGPPIDAGSVAASTILAAAVAMLLGIALVVGVALAARRRRGAAS